VILIIDPEFQSLIPHLRPEELAGLRGAIVSAGKILDPIKVWLQPDGTRDTIIDGHNRYQVYRTTPGLPEPTIELVALPDREAVKKWMLENQRWRRNLSPDQQIMLDTQAGVRSFGPPSKLSQAKNLFERAPDFAALVISGKLTIFHAYNKWLRSKEEAAQVPAVRRTAPRTTGAVAKAAKGRIHVVIGDTQVKPGVLTDHLTWIGRYIAEQFVGQDVALIHLGDHWDMPSLSSYDLGKKASEGRRYHEDVKAGNDAYAQLNAPIEAAMKSGKWKPERHFLFGNHEERISRACNDAAFLEGKISLDDLDTCGWTRHPFLQILKLDGISYAHYFIAQNTGKPLGGENAETRLKNVGDSFTMGHQQGRKWAERSVAGGRRQCGMILGSTYLHVEEYRGPQGNDNWRGICVCHQVEEGTYDPMFISLDYLCRRYEGVTLQAFLKKAA